MICSHLLTQHELGITMKNSNYQIKLRLLLLLPLLASMILVGFYNITNANQPVKN